MNGLFIADDRFELLCRGSTVGRSRYLDEHAVKELNGFAAAYTQLLETANPAASLLDLGQTLFRWLDGDLRQFSKLLQQAPRPVRFEICTANLDPTSAEWSLLRAPWELLANDDGFLAGDIELGYSPLRRLGRKVDPPALGRHRLGLVFMAASPHGTADLDYETEEVAIMKAVGSTKLDLLVEEGGNAEELAERLNEYEPMQVLHLSCHGDNEWQDGPHDPPKPILLLETLEGEELPTGADDLIAALRAHQPRLVFLSACLTAAAAGEVPGGLPGKKKGSTGSRGGVAHSLAEALANAGLPAVLGWDGSVADVAAIAFAAKLYDRLGGRQDLADAVAAARRDLLNASELALQQDWHLARLWLGPQGGGPIVGGTVRRKMMPATHGKKEFLVKERQRVPVASHEMFVGRRVELRQASRALRDGEHSGVLLHGMGRLGKSSLAFRIANRRRDLRLAVVFEQYGAQDVLAALAEALKENRAARDLLRQGIGLVRQSPDHLEDVLVDLLRGPCGELEDGGTPVLLVIDDLERILDEDPKGGRHRVNRGHAPVMAGVLRAFDATINAGNSRLLITSRHPFTLDGLEDCLFELQLPPLSMVAQRKLEQRQKEAAADAGLTSSDFDERAAMLARVPSIARGNPGLQDLIGRKLVLSADVSLERTGKALDEIAAWLRQGGLPSDAEVRAFLENLAVDTLLELVGATGRAFLRRLTLFDVPVPQAVPQKLAALAAVSLQRMLDLGVVDRFSDPVNHRQSAFAVNELVTGRLGLLADNERAEIAEAIVRELFDAWAGATAADGERSILCDLQLTKLGLSAKDGEVVGICAANAVVATRQVRAADALELGRAAIALLDSQHRAVPWRLLSETADAASSMGVGATADALLERGIAMLVEQRLSGPPVDPVAAGFLVYAQAQRLVTRGELDRAQELFVEAAQYAAAANMQIQVATARGSIADILSSRGELDEALRIRREEELPVYERLGDARSRAIALSKIADILQSRGEFDEALRLHREEELPVYARLADAGLQAVALCKIADILFSRGEFDEALRIYREEALSVYERLGDVRSRAVVFGKVANILFVRGELDEALRIRREEELPVYERLGDVRSLAVAQGRIADILESRGELDEALRIRREEELPVFEHLGNVRERAVAVGKIADILFKRGELDESLQIRREEELPVYERLGDVQAHAIALGKMADIHFSRGELDEALRIRCEEQLPVFERLGDARLRAITWGNIANIFYRRGELDEALRIRRDEELPVFDRIGDLRERSITLGGIADILAKKGETDAARNLQLERHAISRRLGDADGIATVLWDLAILDVTERKFSAAAPRLLEAYDIVVRLGHAEGIAMIGAQVGRILAEDGQLERAHAVLWRSVDTYRRLGRQEDGDKVEKIIMHFNLAAHP